MNSALIFDNISKTSLYVAAALIPLWVVPLTQDMVEYQKQALLLVLAMVGVGAWLAKTVYAGELTLRKTWLHIPAVGVLGAFGVSTLFSLWPYGSFWGWPFSVTDSFLTFLGFFVVYMLVSQSIPHARHLLLLYGGFLASVTLAVLFALLRFKGVFESFNTLGDASSVAMIGALLLPFALALASAPLDFARGKKAWRVGMGMVATLLFLSLLLLDFSSAWIVLIAGLGVLVAFDAVRRHQKAGRISLPFIFVLLALFFFIVEDFPIPGAVMKPAEAAPGYREELRVLRSVVAANPTAGFVGTGPGTFGYDYARFRSPELNQTLFWNVRLPSGKAEIADWLITKGALGVLSLGLFLMLAMHVLLKEILRRRNETTWVFATGFFALLAGFAVALFLYPVNFIMWFAFWMSAGGVAFLVGRKQRISLGERSFLVGFAAAFALTAVLLGGVTLGLIGGQKYYAERVYFEGLQFLSKGNGEEAIAKFEAAARANPSVDTYWRTLAQVYLNKTNEIGSDQTIPQDTRQQQIRETINQAIRAAQQATEVAPNNVANWNVRGFVYRNLIGVPGAEALAAEAYQEAQKLEPASPFPWTEMGRIKILSVQAGGQQSLEGAIADLQKAVALKPDYAPAHYLIAVAQDQLGNQAEAIRKLEEAKLAAPGDIGLAFQLGVIYYRQGELGRARSELERAKALNPLYSNARYMLGLAYDRLGRKQDAKGEFAAVSELNPENQEVRDILGNLAAGLPALSGVGQPGIPPVRETPEEIE